MSHDNKHRAQVTEHQAVGRPEEPVEMFELLLYTLTRVKQEVSQCVFVASGC